MTKVESQGTEFHTVISIDQHKIIQNVDDKSFESLNNIKIKNSNYVGYTRAVERLIVYDIKI